MLASDCASSVRQSVESAGGEGSVLAGQRALAEQPTAGGGMFGSAALDRLGAHLGGHLLGLVQVEGAPGERGLHEPGHHHLVRLADLPHDRQGLRTERPMPIAAALPAVQSGQADQGGRAGPGRLGRHRQGALDPAGSLDRVTAEEPETPQAGDEPERGLRIVRARPAQSGAQVVVLAIEQLRLFDDHPGGPFGIVGDGEGKEVGAMRGRQLSRLPGPVEVLGAELPDRLQLPVAGPGGWSFR